MILDEISTPSVYSSNAFHVLGLPVDATGRKVRRRREDLVDECALMGDVSWRREFEKYILGNRTVPKADEVADLFERLKDPEYFATEMFFWVWPRGERPDPALEAMSNGERDKAVRLWQADMRNDDESGVIARHNLAVLLHLYAIDGEGLIRQFPTDKVDANYVRAVDRYWKSALELWKGVLQSDLFWRLFCGRIERLDDPRLGRTFAEAFRARVPGCIDGVNASFMGTYAQTGKLGEASRHFGYIASRMDGAGGVEEKMERVFKPMVSRVRMLVKQCEEAKVPKEILRACRDVLKGSKNLVSLFRAISPEGNDYMNGVLNDIVVTVDKKLRTYSQETGNHRPCLQMARKLQELAATPLLQKKMKEALEMWEGLVLEALVWADS